MKTAVASSGKTPDSMVSPAFGRAPHLIIYENKTVIEVVKNPFSFGGGGSGLGVVQMLHNKNVGLVIAGNFGLNVIEALDEKNMSHKEVDNAIVSNVIIN